MTTPPDIDAIVERAVLAERERLGWHNIESAPISPEDGDEIAILVWVADGGSRGQGCAAIGWRTSRGKMRAMGYWGDFHITHWMPLPPPPTPSSPSEQGAA